jgi:hypothetical protein
MANPKKKGASADYEVGRGKPPKHSRFRPGQSGNPGGRKKGNLNVKTAVQRAMESEIEITENGQKRVVSLLDALILNLVQQGLRGNVKAIQSALNLAERHCDAATELTEELADDDLAILERLSSPGRGRREDYRLPMDQERHFSQDKGAVHSDDVSDNGKCDE